MPLLCLGEAIVDLVCERPAASPAEADSFVPRFGGMAANVAVHAARLGAPVALVGGTGDDAWGGWLRQRLEAEGVDLRWFGAVPGTPTPIALVTVAPDGEPSFSVYGEGIEAALAAAEPRLEEALAAAHGLFLGSNTLVGERERTVTMAARAGALERAVPVVFDPNLRLGRWEDREAARAAALDCVPGALLVKLNRTEAAFLTGEADPDRAARRLLEAGARMVVVTLGAEGALLRGEHELDVPGVPARPVSTVGAGDAVAGVLVGRLALTGFYPPAVAAALPEAVATAARVTEHWGALP